MKYIKKFNEGFFSKAGLIPDMPNLTINDIIEALEEQKPLVTHNREDESFEGDLLQHWDIYETKVQIGDDIIKVLSKRSVVLRVLPIVIINNYQIGPNVNSSKLFNKLKELYKSKK